MNWRRTLGQNLRRMTPEQARRMIDRVRAHGVLNNPVVRQLTGGQAGREINRLVLERLGEKAGFAKYQRGKPMYRQFDPTEQAD